MQDLKISLITVTYNARATISRCIESVVAQGYKNVEYIIIDGGSKDTTIECINKYKDHVTVLVSEPDKGVYDAMNKGILLATGDIVGTLNADDFFASDDILQSVADMFAEQNADIAYGDLDYIDEQGKIIRKWRSNSYKKGIFNLGWMPPHPTFYCKRELFERLGYYSLEYGTAADYELMLRYMHLQSIRICYINKVMVKMQCGGMSNNSPTNRVRAWKFDLRAMRSNGIQFPLFSLIIKPLRKIVQYF
ncbi:glycosyltransferase [Mucilaginibacter mallensis]|uniref:Glycosyltransferase n=1 Tax=Mucilaginibacter mallensis TaxID=652787 RepID=A0A1H2B3X2_MUCMA|nr:glycosyltransferase family 2 protein [Mucilaginibacter mallensis]SDT52873.1 glycosyltransferase [Mucilaginibacter mallensis]